MSAEFDQLVAQFERFQAQMKRVDDQFANVGEMQQKLTELEAVATTPDRAVTVVAGPSGAIKDIRLTDQAMRRPAGALAAELMTTLQKAVAEAARRQAGIVEGALGDDMNLSEQVLESQAQLFGMSKEDLRAIAAEESGPQQQVPPRAVPPPPMPPTPQGAPPRPPAPPRRPAPEPVDDDFSDQNVLRRDSRPAPPPPPSKQDGRFMNLYDDEDGR